MDYDSWKIKMAREERIMNTIEIVGYAIMVAVAAYMLFDH